MAPELIVVNFLDCEWSSFRHLALTSFYWKLNMLIKLWSFFSMLLLPPVILDDWCKVRQNLNVVVPSCTFALIDWNVWQIGLKAYASQVRSSLCLTSFRLHFSTRHKNTNQNLKYRVSKFWTSAGSRWSLIPRTYISRSSNKDQTEGC